MKRILLLLLCAVAIPPLRADDRHERKIFVDLQPAANKSLDEEMNDPVFVGDNLAELPQGRLHLANDVEFQIGPKFVVVAGKLALNRPEELGSFTVGSKITGLQILHACGWGAFGGKANPAGHYQEDGTLIGYYRVNYEDRDWEIVPIVYGRDVRDWWGVWDNFKPTTQSKAGWRGGNQHLKTRQEAQNFPQPLRLFVSVWKNPRPETKVLSIDVVSTKEVAAPFCVAITALAADQTASSRTAEKAGAPQFDGDLRNLQKGLEEQGKELRSLTEQLQKNGRELEKMRLELERIKR